MLTAAWEAGTIIIVTEPVRKGRLAEVCNLPKATELLNGTHKNPQAHAPNHGILGKSICNILLYSYPYIFFITLQVAAT